MNIALRKPISVEAFLDWEERQELRYEFDVFRPIAMTGGTSKHSAIQRNLIMALGIRLRGNTCQVHGSELKIAVAGSIRYPDAFVVCSPIPRGTTVITDPVVVFEVLSPTTATTDRIVKNQEYRDTPSVQRYVMLEQDRQAATLFARQGDD
jgi:Uma2 family endonuclease